MASMSSFFRLVGPTLAPPMLMAVKPRQMLGTSEIQTGEIISQPLSPAKFTPSMTLLESMRVLQVEESPYKVNGPGLPVSIWEPEGGRYVKVRLDMPGVNSVVVNPDPHENSINFKGFEEKITMHGIGMVGDCRIYQGSLHFDPLRFPGLDFNYEFCNGVVSFQIRSIRPSIGGDLGVSLKAKKIEANSEITLESAINPLMSLGKDRYCFHGFKDKAFVFAIDMPGIGELDTLSLNVIGDTINFFAQDKTTQGSYGESMNESRREYEGYFKVNSLEFDPNQAQFEVVHGVFWILVPRKVKPLKELITLLHGARSERLYE